MGSRRPPIEELRRLYWDEQNSPREIGALVGVPISTVNSWLRRYNLPRRSRSDAMRTANARHRPQRREATVPLKDRVRCSGCGWVWLRTENYTSVPCPHCGKPTEQRLRRARQTNVEAVKQYRADRHGKRTGLTSYQRLRRSVLLLVGRGVVACVHCGCDRAELLEVNHINGSGAADMRAMGGSNKFYWAIVHLERDLADLELCCKVCNARHALELRYGPLPYEILYHR